MKKLILTGFEPFGPYKFNPTQDIAREFDGAEIASAKVTGLVLPSSYYKAYGMLYEKIQESGAEIVLGCGLASRIKRIRIEAVGRNIMNGPYPDCEGNEPKNKKISRVGNPHYFTNTNSIELANRLHEQGIDSEVSVDAGAYICNSLIYQVARAIERQALKVKFAYFHTPWTEDYLGKVIISPEKVTIKKSDLGKTVETLVRELALE